ncbi:MAG: NAD(P)H-dependent oxidoreductase [Pseudomonadota bacterium]
MTTNAPQTVLKINSSGRVAGSYSRRLVDDLVARLMLKNPDLKTIERDVSKGVEFVDAEWIEASFTPSDDRSDEQRYRLRMSEQLVAEVQAADTLVFGVPIYNFGVPAVLKAWIDQIARANVTFQYTPDGPVGLLEGKKAYLVITSGGTEADSAIDFASGYMRHVLGFVGITDVTMITADQLMVREAESLESANRMIEAA